jgi:SMI1 / KNR4 family (SUKH-1)
VIEIVDPHPASAEALARAEAELGFALPPEYRSWLAATGAGQPTDDLEIRNGVVTEFYEVEPRGVTYSLTSVRRDRTPDSFDAWVPDDYLGSTAPGAGSATPATSSTPQGRRRSSPAPYSSSAKRSRFAVPRTAQLG